MLGTLHEPFGAATLQHAILFHQPDLDYQQSAVVVTAARHETIQKQLNENIASLSQMEIGRGSRLWSVGDTMKANFPCVMPVHLGFDVIILKFSLLLNKSSCRTMGPTILNSLNVDIFPSAKPSNATPTLKRGSK